MPAQTENHSPRPSTGSASNSKPRVTRGRSGVGRVLVVVYGILALAATGRSIFQIIDRFDDAPLAFSLSAASALVYIVATVALVAPGRVWYRIAWGTILFELVGVLVVGSLSVFAPALLGLDDIDPFGREATVWSVYGAGYVFIPLVLPLLGLWFLRRHPERASAPVASAPAASVSAPAADAGSRSAS